ncbi:MAG: RusA family crossover junction endodeoxyribonuclease [Acidimicrobiales bacterium]
MTREELAILVVGTPAPQGSKRHVGNGVMVESSAKVKPWRQDVKAAALDAIAEAGWEPATGPVSLNITFRLSRPRSHYGTGRNAGHIKSSAPVWVDKRPDLSKLVRSTEDALTEAGVWRDDARVARLVVRKVYAEVEPVGAQIVVETLA